MGGVGVGVGGGGPKGEATLQHRAACGTWATGALQPSLPWLHLAEDDVRRAHGTVGAQLRCAAIDEGAVSKDDFVAVPGGETCMVVWRDEVQ